MAGKLWESFHIGQMELKNRLVMPPMVTQYASPEGYVTSRIKSYYEARAQGGAALLIIEAAYVEKRGQAIANQLNLSEDKFVPGMSELVQTIHRHGAKAAIQLYHGGRRAKSELSLTQPVAPSPLACLDGEIPRELTTNEITRIVTRFVEAAVRAKRAGFDGVELHAAHGYLIDQFLSRSSNKRQDSYGGSLQNRAQFLAEVIKTIKIANGEDYPVWCRINGKEYGIPEGTTLEEAKKIARIAQSAGSDAIHVSAFGPTAPLFNTTPVFVPAIILDLTEVIRKAVTVPVIAVGRITPEAAEGILVEGKADLIAIGKALLADPQLPNKAAVGRLDDITPCILCMKCRDDVFSLSAAGIGCSVNASLGREEEYKITSTRKAREVLVVGGGPAGMEAARVAALRGQKVTLWEKAPRLGGQLIAAGIPPHKDRINTFNEYLQRQLRKLEVKIELNKTATAVAIKKFKPEVVILAMGAAPWIPKIPGLDETKFVHAIDVIEGKVQTGDRVVVIGGELVGCETAEFLADRGRKVTIVRRGIEMALKIGPTLRPHLLTRLLGKGVTLLPGVQYREVTPQGIVVITKGGGTKTIEADTIVLAAGAIPNQKLYQELKRSISEIHLIGDCVRPRSIRDAIAEGYRIGLEI